MKNRRGVRTNPASATNGTRGGRPVSTTVLRRGETLIVERTPLAPGPEHPFTPPEDATVLSVSASEIEIQIGDDILVLRRPDTEDALTLAAIVARAGIHEEV